MTGDDTNVIQAIPPVSKTIVIYQTRGEISSDFFVFLSKKGLLYGEEGIRYAQEQIREHAMSGDAIRAEEDLLIREGWREVLQGIPVRQRVRDLLRLAEDALSADEQIYLDYLHTVIHREEI